MHQAAIPSHASTSRVLCRLGVLLILLGLATGSAIPLFDDARQGLAAHTVGGQNGILLTVLGLLWDRLRLGARLARVAAFASVFSLYAIWVAFLLAATFGTGGTGAGHGAEAWQGALVVTVRGAGSVALLAALLAVLWGLRPLRAGSE
jgi:hydroxylaminobenzene mutase